MSANFDKMINDSQNIVPKRLSFDFLNSSGINSSSKIKPHEDSYQLIKFCLNSDSAAKKRKFSETEYQDLPTSASKNGSKMNESLNSSSGSLCASWETKLLRSDLIEAQSRVSREVTTKTRQNLNIFHFRFLR